MVISVRVISQRETTNENDFKARDSLKTSKKKKFFFEMLKKKLKKYQIEKTKASHPIQFVTFYTSATKKKKKLSVRSIGLNSDWIKIPCSYFSLHCFGFPEEKQLNALICER